MGALRTLAHSSCNTSRRRQSSYKVTDQCIFENVSSWGKEYERMRSERNAEARGANNDVEFIIFTVGSHQAIF